MMTEIKPRFDPTINLGHVLTFVGFMFAGYAAVTTMQTEISTVSLRTASIEKQVEKLTEVLVVAARAQVEITELRRRLDRIENENRSGR